MNILQHTAFLLLLCLLPCACIHAHDNNLLREQTRALLGSIDAVTQEKLDDPQVQLGRALFWDQRLSRDGKTACASCHYRENHGSDSRARSIDARGNETGLHSMTVFNTQTATAGLRWFADRDSGAAQALGSITGSMGFESREELEARLLEFGYAQRFSAAGASLDAEAYAQALEAYQRSLRTPAAFDSWLKGDNDAMNAQQLAGLQRFLNSGCGNCHNGPLLGGGMLQKFGVTEDYWIHTGSRNPHDGLMEKTGQESDRYFFRVSPLRNVAATAPYFHDASVDSLDLAVSIMARVQLGQTLDATRTEELVSFLESLTGELPSHFSAPADIPFSLPAGIARQP